MQIIDNERMYSGLTCKYKNIKRLLGKIKLQNMSHFEVSSRHA